MGMRSRAMGPSRFPMTMEEWYLIRKQEQATMSRNSPPLREKKSNSKLSTPSGQWNVELNPELVPSLERMAAERNITIDKLINIRLQAMVNAYDNQRTLGLTDQMPFGQYKHVVIEDLIKADGRYVRWLYATSEIFELDDEARVFLEENS